MVWSLRPFAVEVPAEQKHVEHLCKLGQQGICFHHTQDNRIIFCEYVVFCLCPLLNPRLPVKRMEPVLILYDTEH